MDEYLRNISQKYARTDAREMIYRADFEILLKEIFGVDGKIKQINHDSTNDNGNKPDFVISNNEIPLAYIEAKDIGVSLDKVEKSDQMNRYFGYSNLILTDYVEFRFYRNGSPYGTPISIASINKTTRTLLAHQENFQLLINTLLDFASSHKEPIKSGRHLAQIMGGKARRIKDNVREMLESPSERYSDLIKIKDVVKQSLVSGLDDEQFADMYSQTLVYGLFAARYNDTTPDDFSRSEARDLVPASNPFLRSFFEHIAGSSFPERLRFIVDELCEVFSHADLEKILKDFYLKEKDSKDPVIHFYEDFLREYDPKKKMEMGVFYTPRPVVQFIIRAIDSVLKDEFGLSAGLADHSKIQHEETRIDPKGKEIKVHQEYHKVQVLDIATGTGTFLNETIHLIYESFHKNRGAWEPYVREHLLPRLHGFELMMASYTIAHLKLGVSLSRTGANGGNERLGVYLTNTLDKPTEQTIQPALLGFMDSITEESRLASKIKRDYPIMVVMGNPPYSGISMNKQYKENEAYKVEPGGKERLKEKKNWLDDDYVKFIRFGETMIDKNKDGILGMITAHGYIDNPTFRGMRWHLQQTFDSIYILDLHGNSNKDEVAPDGSKDENVFDIKTGVSIIIGIKRADSSRASGQPGQVYISDLYGKRAHKFECLDKADFDSMDWKPVQAGSDVWRIEGPGKADYKKGFSIDDLFKVSSTGVVTMGDSFIVSTSKTELKSRIEEFLYRNSSEGELKQKYKLGKNYAKWILQNKSKIEFDDSRIIPIDYRPFDTRYTYFDPLLIWRSRMEVMKNMIGGNNLALVASRQVKAGENWSHVFISNKVCESSLLSNKTGEIGSVFPLYTKTTNGEAVSNLSIHIVSAIQKIAGETSPENVLDYVYGYLHNKSYISKYREFLKTDFPKVPYPTSKEEFWNTAEVGSNLRATHLMQKDSEPALSSNYPIEGNNIVSDVRFETNLVHVNESQYFDNVSSDIWNYRIGSYLPAQKYLKDRKSTALSSDEITQYRRLLNSINQTLET